MTRPGIEVLLLDVHGVVLNNPFREFLRELAIRTDQSPESVSSRWDRELRLPTWTGEMEERELWRRLSGRAEGKSAAHWRWLLETYYALGPVAPALRRWRSAVPIWLLSNHRTDWLLPRLDRFGLTPFFDRVLVSDVLHAAKPSAAAFRPILASIRTPERVLFIDDQRRNVEAARELGMRALILEDHPSFLRTVDQLLSSPGQPRPDPRLTGPAAT